MISIILAVHDLRGNVRGERNANAPVAGRNSFTAGQAKSKIEEAGYTNVTELKKKTTQVLGAEKPAKAALPLR